MAELKWSLPEARDEHRAAEVAKAREVWTSRSLPGLHGQGHGGFHAGVLGQLLAWHNDRFGIGSLDWFPGRQSVPAVLGLGKWARVALEEEVLTSLAQVVRKEVGLPPKEWIRPPAPSKAVQKRIQKLLAEILASKPAGANADADALRDEGRVIELVLTYTWMLQPSPSEPEAQPAATPVLPIPVVPVPKVGQ